MTPSDDPSHNQADHENCQHNHHNHHDSIPKQTNAAMHQHGANCGHHQTAHHNPVAAEAQLAETRTRLVVAVSVLTMIAEISFGYWTGSMALTADGWHMASHAGAMLVTLFAYWLGRQSRFISDEQNSTQRLYALSGYTSGLMLVAVGASIFFESGHRLFFPTSIIFKEAIIVTIIGLVVNLVCAKLLHIDTEHTDQNLRAAFMHVLADALTSVLALVALVAGRYLGWLWFDAVMGIVGGILVLRWSVGLLRDTGQVLIKNATKKKSH